MYVLEHEDVTDVDVLDVGYGEKIAGGKNEFSSD